MTARAGGVKHGRLSKAAADYAEFGERVLRALGLTQVGIWEVDREGRTTFVNEAAAAMTGHRPEQLRGRRVDELIAGACDLVERFQLERVRPGARAIRQARIRHRDGCDIRVVISSAPLLEPDGRYAGATLALLDVPDPRMLEPQTGAWVLELETGKLEWSDETYRIFGVARSTFEPSYDSAMALVHPQDRPLVERSIAAMLVDQKPFSAYFRTAGVDGQRRVLHARAEASLGEARRRLTGIVRDVTSVAERRIVSSREREVLDLLANGMTAREIAGRLQISTETVRTHIKNAVAKLDAHNRVHAVALAVASGEIGV